MLQAGGIILGQSVPLDPISGWFSAIIQGGSFALISWLVVIEKPRADKRILDSYDAAIAAFTKELKYERDQCDKSHDALLIAVAGVNRNIDETRNELRSAIYGTKRPPKMIEGDK
mgnify:FL=1